MMEQTMNFSAKIFVSHIIAKVIYDSYMDISA